VQEKYTIIYWNIKENLKQAIFPVLGMETLEYHEGGLACRVYSKNTGF
jgi:hypothetical protein